MDYEKEISFGAFDSELMHQEIYIPEGFTATIDGNKIILKKIESEDEKIRQVAIEFVKQNTSFSCCLGISKEQVLEWLEKQGKNKEINEVSYRIGIKRVLDNPESYGLEKQGEKKSSDEVLKIRQELYQSGYNDGYKHGCEDTKKQAEVESDEDDIETEEKDIKKAFNKIWDEKQGEQKPVDKVEPKFKVGNWIISNNKKSTYQVMEVKRGIYVIRDNADNHEYHIGIEECEKSGRLFTIQDAKPGDVLYSHCLRLLWIFKSRDTVYCGCNLNYNDGAFCGEGYIETPTDAIPAAKEQRNILFQKMKEAGYEWDDEKKELKKIEQEELSDFEKSLKHIIEEAIDDGDTHNLKADAELLLGLMQKPSDEEMKELLRTEYEKGRADDFAQMQKEWSKEDEKMFRSVHNLIYVVPNCNCDSMRKKELSDWLELLKNRVQPQNHWKPSDAQMKALKGVQEGVFRLGILESLYQELKKLREE